MRFIDFSIGLDESFGTRTKPANMQSRAFVRAVRTGLRLQHLEAPWRKLYIQFSAATWGPTFGSASPHVGISAAGVLLGPPDPAMLGTQGEAIRPVLARAATDLRSLIAEGSGWNDDAFWSIVAEAGRRVGPYRRTRMSRLDRRERQWWDLDYEWDEVGTRVYLASRAASDGRPLARRLVRDFPGEWEIEWDAAFDPKTLRIEPERVTVIGRDGQALAAVPTRDIQ